MNDSLMEHLLHEGESSSLDYKRDQYPFAGATDEEKGEPRRAELLRLHRRLLATCCEPDRHPARAGWQARIVDLIGHGVRPCVPQRTIELADGVEMVFSYIPPGSF